MGLQRKARSSFTGVIKYFVGRMILEKAEYNVHMCSTGKDEVFFFLYFYKKVKRLSKSQWTEAQLAFRKI